MFVSPQRYFHQSVIRRLCNALEDFLPPGHEVVDNMSVKLARQQRPEPDLMVVDPHANFDLDVTCFQAGDVILAVEVVSPDSELRDRERKPVLYAEAGIPHFWRIEEVGGKPAVFVFERDPGTKTYALAGVHHDRLKLTVPFDIDIDLTKLCKRRTR
ncbi:Uma2 family endonuclease [Nonomuraea helvata]